MFRLRWPPSRRLFQTGQDRPAPQPTSPATGSVLVVLDGSADTAALMDHAMTMATLPGASLHVLACGERLQVTPENLLFVGDHSSTAHEQEALARCVGNRVIFQHHLACDQSIVARVRELVMDLQITSVVLTGRGSSGSRLVRPLTEVAADLTRLGHAVEIVVVKPPPAPRTARRKEQM